MQTHRLGGVGTRSALTLLIVMSGGAALAQDGSSGMPSGGGNVSKLLDMKVSVDATNERLVVVIPKLLKTVDAEFSIDADVKNALLSSHLSNVKLQTVLDVLLRTSDIPVQYVVEKGVYHFSKRLTPIPEPLAAKPQIPNGPLLPPPPKIVQDDVDVHNVQTYDLLRVLNGIFGVPVAIDPDGDGAPPRPHSGGNNGVGQGSLSTGGGASGNSIGGSRNRQFGSSQNGSGGTVVSLFGHSFRLNNTPSNSGNNPANNPNNNPLNGLLP